MTSVVALDDVASIFMLERCTYSCKRMRYSPIIGGISSVQWRKLEETEDFECVFIVYCVLESK